MKINKWLLLIFISFFIIEIFSQFTWNVLGDDIVYYAMSKSFAEDLIPYKDFFYAHPPLQILLGGFIFKISSIFGISNAFTIKFMKIIAILTTIANIYILYLIVKKDLSEKIAVISSALILFTPTFLFNGAYTYGLEIALLLFLLGIYFEHKHYIQNILFLSASMYRFHILFLIIGYTLYKISLDLNYNWKSNSYNFIYLRRFIWFISLFLILNGLLKFLVPNYYTYVFSYHLNKPNANLGTFLMVSTALKINYFIFILLIAFLLFYLKQAPLILTKYLIIPIPFLAYFLINISFGYYFLYIIPFIAVISAYTINKINYKLVYVPLIFFMVISVMNYALLKPEGIPKLDVNNKLITGEPAMISFLKLTNNNKIMLNELDVNSMIYEETNVRNITLLIAQIMTYHPMVIVREDEGIYPRNREFRDYVNTCNLIQIKQKYRVYEC